MAAPDGFRPFLDVAAFADSVGPLHLGPGGVLGVRVVGERHPGTRLEARRAVERMGGRLAFAECSVTADGREAVRTRAVFAVRSDTER